MYYIFYKMHSFKIDYTDFRIIDRISFNLYFWLKYNQQFKVQLALHQPDVCNGRDRYIQNKFSHEKTPWKFCKYGTFSGMFYSFYKKIYRIFSLFLFMRKIILNVPVGSFWTRLEGGKMQLLKKCSCFF